MQLMITILIAVLLLLSVSCLPGDPMAGSGPDFITEIVVDTGYTTGDHNMGESSTFTIRWTAAEGAEWYEVRISPDPISDSNWDEAVRIDSIPSTGSFEMSANVQIQPGVFENTCISCGLCIEACPQNAIHQVSGKAVIDT
jgi:ferredoxin